MKHYYMFEHCSILSGLHHFPTISFWAGGLPGCPESICMRYSDWWSRALKKSGGRHKAQRIILSSLQRAYAQTADHRTQGANNECTGGTGVAGTFL